MSPTDPTQPKAGQTPEDRSRTVDGLPIVHVVLDLPLAGWFDYQVPAGLAVAAGDWVVVPWGRGRRVGLVIEEARSSELPAERLKAIIGLLPDMPRADAQWLGLLQFAARYYHCPLGEIALPSVPKLLRAPPAARSRGSAVLRARQRFEADRAKHAGGQPEPDHPPQPLQSSPFVGASDGERVLTDEQANTLSAFDQVQGHAVHLLHGITGSGKTEIYLRWIEQRLSQPLHTSNFSAESPVESPAESSAESPVPSSTRPQQQAAPGSQTLSQALILVPEIALTPVLAQRIRERFPHWPLAVLHSDMPEAERAAHWLAAAEGRARIVLGTRLAVLAPLPGLVAVVVDEEHDPSFKQQEGARYSARDLAIALAARRGVPVVLGSATPSLESWRAAQTGRYRLHSLIGRASGAALPEVRVLSLPRQSPEHGLTEPAIEAVRAALARGEQTLVFLNRRGYAPVLSCAACGWLSQCPQCDAWRVMHRESGRQSSFSARSRSASIAGSSPTRQSARDSGPSRYRLVCHHCAAESPVPRMCPDCGNVDLTGLGQGTQRLEEHLAQLFPAARVGRLDRDVARHRGAAASFMAAAHAGEVDILLGTQMLAKGHDFERLTQVVVVDADAALYAADFRAPERLFATLMQVAGRAGRHRSGAVVWVQTRFAEHPLFAALQVHDYAGFAAQELQAREATGLPPFMFQALLTAQARTLEAAQTLLMQARALIDPLPEGIILCDPVPMPLAQLRGDHRLQMLIESASRPALHAMLGPWVQALHGLRTSARWQLVVDPLEI